MRKLKVSFRPSAEADLRELYDYIANEASASVAAGYIDRIETACLGLETFPMRGRSRDEIRPGIRTLGFERRATIVYRVLKFEVVILRIVYGGREFERLLRNAADE